MGGFCRFDIVTSLVVSSPTSNPEFPRPPWRLSEHAFLAYPGVRVWNDGNNVKEQFYLDIYYVYHSPGFPLRLCLPQAVNLIVVCLLPLPGGILSTP